MRGLLVYLLNKIYQLLPLPLHTKIFLKNLIYPQIDRLIGKKLNKIQIDNIKNNLSRTNDYAGEVLIIDNLTPRANRDSGSIDQINFIKILTENNYRVYFLPSSNLAFDGKYSEYLVSLGVITFCKELHHTTRNILKTHGEKFSHILFYRYTNFFLLERLADKFSPSSRKILMTVDLHHIRDPRIGLISRKSKIKEKELLCIDRADTVVVVSESEKLYLETLGYQDIFLLPLLRENNDSQPKNIHKDVRIGFIGGFNHPPNEESIKWIINSLWPNIQKMDKNGWKISELIICGSNIPQSFIDANKVDGIKFMQSIEDEKSFFDLIDISIAPIFSGAGLKGKVVSSFSYCVPVIGTEIAFDGFPEKFSNEAIFLIANNPQEYLKQIEHLVLTEDLYKEISQHCNTYFNKNFTRNILEERVLQILS
jgi:glycosyltransferase involved in cell wall biosynthesis